MEPTAKPETSVKPTVVLVHGAFADSSGWNDVEASLQADGYTVLAFSNPLRGIKYDSQYLRDFLSTIDGPIVLVGHSYGGALITNAATGNPNVKSLVYIAAYALAEGESVQAANELGGGHTDVIDHLVIRPFPGATEGNADAYIGPAYFPQLFAQDVPMTLAKSMAAAQRPGALASLVTPSGAPAWESIPQLVHGRQERPHHPAGGRTGNGRPRRRHHRRSQHVTRADDQPATEGDQPHQVRSEVDPKPASHTSNAAG